MATDDDNGYDFSSTMDFEYYDPTTNNPGSGWALFTTTSYFLLWVFLFPFFVALRQWCKRRRAKQQEAATPLACAKKKSTVSRAPTTTSTSPPFHSRRHHRRRRQQAQLLVGNWLTQMGRGLKCKRSQCCVDVDDYLFHCDGNGGNTGMHHTGDIGDDDNPIQFTVYSPAVAASDISPMASTPYQPPSYLVSPGNLLVVETRETQPEATHLGRCPNMGEDASNKEGVTTDFWDRVVDDFTVDVVTKDDDGTAATILEDSTSGEVLEVGTTNDTTYIRFDGHKYAIDLWGGGPRPWIRYLCSRGFCRKLSKCARVTDTEFQKLVRLAAPFALNTLVEDICGNLLETIVISRCLGSHAVVAFFAVEFLITLATMVLEGMVSSLTVLCASSCDTMERAGRYAQMAVLIHQVWMIPLVLGCWNALDGIALLLGLDEDTTAQAVPYARLALVVELISVYDDVLHYVLEVVGKEQYSALLNGSHAVSRLVLVLLVLVCSRAPALWMVGIVHLALALGFLGANVVVVGTKQLLGTDFWTGAIKSGCWNDHTAVRRFFQAAIPLSLGYVVEYCEWEILFLFAAAQGPAELAVWGFLGAIWDVAENIGAACADAAEVRVAQLLGRNQPAEARQAAHKALFWGVASSVLVAVLLASISSVLPCWISSDVTLQLMLRELLPQLCIGLAVLSFGTLSWSILCAQGRASLATFMCLLGSVGVTLPWALFTTFVLNFNLHGLLTSVVIGYATSGALISFMMVTTNWKKISDHLAEETRHQGTNKTTATNSETGSFCTVPDYDDYDWDELPDDGKNRLRTFDNDSLFTSLLLAKSAAAVLGFTENSWDGDLPVKTSEKDWVELTRRQQAAASKLGYDQTRWDNS